MLSYIDDIENASKCGLNSLENNTIITKLVETKRLNFNVGSTTKKSKCERLHVGKNNEECTNLSVRDKDINNVKEITYLGDLVCGSGKNMKNIVSRVAKGKGIVMEIFNILDNISFGPHFFKIALMLRESLFISSTFYNSSV